MGVFLSLVFCWFVFLCHYPALLYSYSEVMCTQYTVYFLSLLPSSGSVCSLYILVFLAFFFFVPALRLLLHYGVRCSYVCTPCLWSLPPWSCVVYIANHLLVSLEVYLNSLSLFFSLTPSHSSFSDTPYSHYPLLAAVQVITPFPSSSLSPIPKLESWRSWFPCLSYLLYLFWFSYSPLAIIVPLLFPPSSFISHPFSPLSTHLPLPASPSGLIRREGGCLVCVCVFS